jgi:hypothetical protein
MDDPKLQLVERLKSATNILVTVSSSPSVDQLAACIGLTLLLNKQNKHATAIFSGQTPSTIEFLKPAETLEKNTNSLRDFIIALDKAKANKLRYKVEDEAVKIFITPYHTSISQKDLEFTMGDFNVEVVLALGVQKQEYLDEAITKYGRILHDATVISLTNQPGGNLGNINWEVLSASSLCEMVLLLTKSFEAGIVDNQIATALLTGIVAETERFSNAKTSPQTMSLAAELMAAGADQQLIANELREPTAAPAPEKAEDKSDKAEKPKADKDGGSEDAPAQNDGAVEIAHEKGDKDSNDEVTVDGLGDSSRGRKSGGRMITKEPAMTGTLTANSKPEGESANTDPLVSPTGPASGRMLSGTSAPRKPAAQLPPIDSFNDEPATPSNVTPDLPKTDDKKVEEPTLDDVRQAVEAARKQSDGPEVLDPIKALNANPMVDDLHPESADPTQRPAPLTDLPKPAAKPFGHDPFRRRRLPTLPTHEPAPGAQTSPADKPLDMPLPPSLSLPPIAPGADKADKSGKTPPPVPPPLMPPSFLNRGSTRPDSKK